MLLLSVRVRLGFPWLFSPRIQERSPPVDFAKEIFSCLDLYTDEVLDAWYGLFKTGDGKYFQQLMKAVGA